MPERRSYYAPSGGLPAQTELLTGRAVFTEAYAVIPKDVLRDIVTSLLPHWEGTRAWILARPLSGFAETFSQYIVEVAPGGGSDNPEPDPGAEAGLFAVSGSFELMLARRTWQIDAGGFAYIPPGAAWQLRNRGSDNAVFHWIRKRYEAVEGLAPPDPIVTSDRECPAVAMPDTEGRWATTRFIDPDDMRYDMHVNIVSFEPGAPSSRSPRRTSWSTASMCSQGKGVYRLNQDWVEVEAGDFMWLRAFCPQACYAGGPGPFRYLLYKDVNRHPRLAPLL